ncbi:portal protein, partial [Herbiconiux daphne]
MANTRTGFGADGAKAVYERLKSDRNQYTTRAENNAAVTIPSIFPKDGDNASTKYTTPWQSVGARGLNNLAAKLMLALFPQQTWMRLDISEWLEKQIVDDPSLREKAQQSLSMIERILMKFMEGNSYKVTLFEAIKQLVVAGNALLYLPEPTGEYTPMKLYKLSSYVVQRDGFGTMLQCVTLDKIAFAALPEDVRSKLSGEHKPDEQMEVYTHCYLDDESNQYLKYEEIDGVEVEGTDASYPMDSCPFIPIRMIRQDGENYGRSYVEEFYGDLLSLERLQESIVGFAMISSKVVGLVNPMGNTQVKRLSKAQTGDFVPGRAQDIEFLQLGKGSDFSVAKQTIDALEQRLSYVFMLNSAVQRGGDRVTAEEIRYVAQELQDTLGGIYSVLSQELQLSLIRVLLSQLQATKKIPELPKEAITPSVVTGLEAIGRGQDQQKLMDFANAMASLQALSSNPDINVNVFTLRLANSMGIDTDGILLTDAEKAEKVAESAVQTGAENFGGSLGAGAAAAATS